MIAKYIPETFWFGRFDVMRKIVSSKEKNAGIAVAIARPVKCVFNTMPLALFHRASIFDEDGSYFSPQKSAKIKRFGFTLLTLLTLSLLTSCVKEDYFGKSNYGNIKRIVVSNQSGNATINQESKTVSVEIPGGVDLSGIIIEILELSSFATSDKGVGDVIDLTDEAALTIIAEDGTSHIWKINAFVASSTPQLENGDLNQWYKTSANYFEPGESAATTIWGTGNRGTQILNKLATVPEDLGDGNLAARMETLDNGPFAAIIGAPISAGSLFTGVFNPDKIDPSNPEAAIEFGTPFTGRPDKVSVKFSYSPGEQNKDKQGNSLPYVDACDIYVLLEIRQGDQVERLATAWFRSDDVHPDLTTIEIPFNYGALDESFPEYMKPAHDQYVSDELAVFSLPTHVTFVATSSFDGAHFAGAVGSTLIVDDVEFVYE